MLDAAPAREPFHVLCKPIGPKCNLNCDYCFYLKKEDLFPDNKSMKDFRMDDETLENFVKQYIQAQHPNAPEVNFAWQGGEPTLLGIDYFRKVVELQEKYKRDNQKISNAFQTNGVLLNDEWAELFLEHDFLIGISIDGPKEIHDHFRKDWGGRGSFDRVMAGLETLKRNKVEFNTLTVVQNHNADYPRDIYRFLKKIGSTFFQFIPIVEPLPEGGVSERSVRPEQFGNFMCRILDEWIKGGDIGKIYVQQFELMISLALGYPSSMCVHSKTCGRSVAMEHNGNLYSCDHFVNPDDLLGNIAETPLNLLMDGGKQTKFGRDKYDSLPQYCMKCKYLRFCYGACPSDRVKNTPDGEPGLNHNCEGYYQFYDYSLPYFNAMAECLKRGLPAIEYPRFIENQSNAPKASDGSKVGRNDPCPCGSGKKYKKCCARK